MVRARAYGSDCVSRRNCGGFAVVSRDPGGWLPMALPALSGVWLDNEWPAAGIPPWRGSKRDRPPDDLISDMPAAVQPCLCLSSDLHQRAEGLLMTSVMIGVDPHKASHTAVAIDPAEVRLGEVRVKASSRQAARLLEWAADWPERSVCRRALPGSMLLF